MLTHQDEKRIKDLIREEVEPIQKKVNHIDNNVDKILKIFTDEQKENAIVKAKVDRHHSRLRTRSRTTSASLLSHLPPLPNRPEII